MRCAVLHAPGDVRVEQRPDAVAGPGESLVRVTSVGLCGSDLHWFAAGAIGDAAISRPLVLGHEMAGVVRLRSAGRPLGRAGPGPALRPVPRVHGPAWSTCAPGCASPGTASTDGGLRELVAWPDQRIHLLPDGYDPACGALLEPLGVAVHSADLAHLRPGWKVAVTGCGPIGLMLVQLAATAGCEVVAVEPLAHRREAALRAGAAADLTPDEVTGSGREGTCDVAFEVSGSRRRRRPRRHARPAGRADRAGRHPGGGLHHVRGLDDAPQGLDGRLGAAHDGRRLRAGRSPSPSAARSTCRG